jgi:hypothetical protein
MEIKLENSEKFKLISKALILLLNRIEPTLKRDSVIDRQLDSMMELLTLMVKNIEDNSDRIRKLEKIDEIDEIQE